MCFTQLIVLDPKHVSQLCIKQKTCYILHASQFKNENKNIYQNYKEMSILRNIICKIQLLWL